MALRVPKKSWAGIGAKNLYFSLSVAAVGKAWVGLDSLWAVLTTGRPQHWLHDTLHAAQDVPGQQTTCPIHKSMILRLGSGVGLKTMSYPSGVGICASKHNTQLYWCILTLQSTMLQQDLLTCQLD